MSGCFPLTASKACPMYSEVSIKASDAYNTVTEFDGFVQTILSSEFGGKCQAFKNEGLRYQISTACSIFIGISKGDCNAVDPWPICDNFVAETVRSMQTVARGSCNTSIPPPLLKHIADMAGRTECLPATTNEIDRCGFITVEEQKQFCYRTNFTDNCCASFRTAQNFQLKIQETQNIPPPNDYSQVIKDRYLGTAMFIFTTIGSTTLFILIVTISIMLILKRQIQLDKMPSQPKRLPDKVASRSSFYF